MISNLDNIGIIRRRLGLTQTELALKSGISQSLIAKIESGKLDPSYTNAQKIFDALNKIQQDKQPTAHDLVHKGIISIQSSDLISDAVKKMRRYGISQVPVIDDGAVVGLVSESSLLDALLTAKKTKIAEVMGDSPPVISANTSMSAISSLIKFVPLIIVQKKGKYIGCISKTDVLDALS